MPDWAAFPLHNLATLAAALPDWGREIRPNLATLAGQSDTKVDKCADLCALCEHPCVAMCAFYTELFIGRTVNAVDVR